MDSDFEMINIIGADRWLKECKHITPMQEMLLLYMTRKNFKLNGPIKDPLYYDGHRQFEKSDLDFLLLIKMVTKVDDEFLSTFYSIGNDNG